MRTTRDIFVLGSSALLMVLCAASITAVAQQPALPGPVLDQLQQTAQNAVSHISALRIEKWKTDSGTKHSAQADAESLQRNMASALPELIAKVRSAPQDLNSNFKLYRNTEVLYDVFSRFTETAGAFGPRDEYEALAQDLSGLESARHDMGNILDSLTASTQAELDRLHAQIRAAQQAAAAAPPKKVVVDDSQPAPARHKKSSPKSTTSPKKAATPAPSATPTPKAATATAH